MKPPETVTIIDFQGEVATIPVSEIKQYAEDFRKPREQRFSERNGYRTHDAERWGFMSNQVTLMLKGLDVGHFNDLAIYQATLGRYWEVPWYETPNEGVLTQGEWYQYLNEDLNCNSAWYRKGCEFGFDNLWEVEGFFNTRLRNEEPDYEDSKECCRRLSNASAIKPSIEDFCKHYPNVFSKLTPWKGE
jgi:hypothetical protein